MLKTRRVFKHGSSGTTITGRSHHALTVPTNSAQIRVPSTVTGTLLPGNLRPTETPTMETVPSSGFARLPEGRSPSPFTARRMSLVSGDLDEVVVRIPEIHGRDRADGAGSLDGSGQDLDAQLFEP